MRCRWTWTLSVGLACLASVAAAGPTSRPAIRPVDRTIAHLDAIDPAVRNAATDALANSGESIRPAVIAALSNASPEAADRLATVLLRTVTWDKHLAVSTDGDTAQPAARYETLPTLERMARVASLDGTATTPALLQVLTSDPSPAVRWEAVDKLRATFEPPASPASDDGAIHDVETTTARSMVTQVLALADAPAGPSTYPVPAENGPMLAAAAWAAQQTDPARADALLAKALAIEAAHPSAFYGQARVTYLWAIDRATDRGDFATAVDLCRQWAFRTSWSDGELPEPVGDLFALQAEHGPFPGLADDLRLYRPYLVRPEVLYCLARLADRQATVTGRAASVGLTTAALAISGTSVDARCEVGRFLLSHNWPIAARRELEGCRWLPGADASMDLDLALHALAVDCDDDTAAGRSLEAALKKSTGGPDSGMIRTSRYGQAVPWTRDDQLAEVQWHYLRVASTAGDRAAAMDRARQLLDLDISGQVLAHDPGMAADIVPVLADAGRLEEADRCFTAAYKALGRDVTKHPAEPMPKNNLAWLCARSGRNLDEAERLSADAIRLAPLDAACLDTRAEVLFRAGRASEAATLEARALSIKPDDVYMQRQLARFRSGGH